MEKEEKVQVQAGQEKQPEGQKKKMKTRTKVIAGVAVAALACGVGTGAYLITKNGGIEELLEDSPLADLADKIKGDDVDAGSAGNQDKDGADGASGAGGASGTDGAVQQTGYVDNGGAQVGGTSASNSYPIKMSDLCTFSDPSGLSFDTRYVLHGGSDCIPAKRVASTGYSCKEAYVILYARGGQAVGQYECYVMNSEADAKGLASALAAAYGFSCGNWGDVAYMYTPGSYVQESISTYYKQGVIKSETPAAYLGMQFYFGGMSEYQPSAPSGGSSGGNGGGGGSTPGGSTPGGSTPGGNTPGGNTPGGTDDPSTPTDPEEPEDPDTPDKPDASGETSVAVTEAQLTDDLEEALATADSTFPVEITDKYTFEDPEGLEYDTRYVLYGGEDSGAVTAVSMAGATANGVYDIYYLKDGKLAAVYRCYDAASADDAAQIESMYGGMGEVKVTGRVACIDMDLAMIESMMEMYVQMGYADEATPEAYMAALYKNEGYQYFRNPNPAEEPEEPSGGLTGTTPDEAFSVKVSDSYTFDEAQVLPGTAYDRRYVLYGDETNGFAAQQGAEAFYDVIYEQSSQALYEIKIYVMPGEEEAQTLAGQLVTAGMDAKVMPGTDAVLVIGRDLQETIDTYVESGLLSEATPRAYIEGFLMKLGMTEVTADGNALSCTSLPQADLNRLLYEAEGLLETSGTQWNETEFEPLIPAPGVLDPEADLSSESVAQAAREAEAFDPADAGVMAEDAGQQDSFDPASAGNAGQAADGQSEMAQAAEGASQGEVFDPSTAGSVPAGTDGTEAAGNAAAGAGSEAAADGGMAGESGGTALTAGTTADWNDPDFDDAADRLISGSTAAPQELLIAGGLGFADPQDLDFDTRLVFRGDARSALAAQVAGQRQIAVTQVYEILYAKDGQAVAQYRCIVAGDQVFCQRMKPEKLAERISALPAGQPAFAASLQGYTEWIQQMEQLEAYKEGEETR